MRSPDAGQFDTHEHISVPIDLNISRQAPTTTRPSSATPIDLSSIGPLLGGETIIELSAQESA